MRCWLAVLSAVSLVCCAEPAADGGVDLCSRLHCHDGDDCTEDICDPTDPRVCVFPPAQEGTPCNGGGVCDDVGNCIECDRDQDCEDDFNDCTSPFCEERSCASAAIADGTSCSGGACRAGQCELSGEPLPCTEQGIRNAIAAGGGSYTFDCDGPTTVTTESEIVIDKNVVLGGLGNLSVNGNGDHRVFSVLEGTTVWFDGIAVAGGFAVDSCGGLLNDGILTLAKSVVHGNDATSGGGICNSGTLTLVDSTVAINTAKNCGGISNSGTLSLANSTIFGNAASSGGGGICNSGLLEAINGVVVGNTAEACAGIYSNRTATLTGSRVSHNIAAAGGGGVCNSGTLSVMGSTFAYNSGAYGGGIENSGTLLLSNSTISGNVSEEEGSGIFNIGEATMTSTTVSGSGLAGEHCDVRNVGSIAVANTLLVGCCSGHTESIGSDGYSIESPGDTCGFDRETDLPGVPVDALRLDALADNGGPTKTIAPRPGSIAIDRVPEAICETEADQRGVARPQGVACDIGAFELEQGDL